MDDSTRTLVSEIDALLRCLRTADTQALAIAWMKQAHHLLGRCAAELEGPRVYAVPGLFGPPTFTLAPPKPAVLPPGGFKPAPPVWLRGHTVVYGEKKTAWTRKDTLRLERSNGKGKSR